MINRQIIDFEIKKTGISPPPPLRGAEDGLVISYQLSVKFPTGRMELSGFPET
jgi:hypothetical protein